MKKIILIGAGGHCKSCIEVIESLEAFSIEGILDPNLLVGSTLLGYSLIGDDAMIPSLIKQGYAFLITIGQIQTSTSRKIVFDKIKQAGGTMITLVSPHAIVSKHAIIGEGTVVLHGAVVNADVVIRENCIINTSAIIEHDVQVGAHSHISTNAVLNGAVKIGVNCFIGSGSILVQGVSVDDDVIIGANATVLNSIPKASTYVGTPAQPLKKI